MSGNNCVMESKTKGFFLLLVLRKLEILSSSIYDGTNNIFQYYSVFVNRLSVSS